MEKPIEEQLKEIILNSYGDMKSFAVAIDMPNSTLDSMFRRGLMNARISNVIQVARALGISVDGLADSQVTRLAAKECMVTGTEEYLLETYRQLNPQGQEYILQTVHMAAQIYKNTDSSSGMEEQDA